MKIFSALLVFFGTSSLVTIEVLHVLSELSELIELPEVFSSMKKCLFCGALRPGDPLIKLLKLRFVSLNSETSRSFQTSQSSQSSITSHPVFPDACAGPLDCNKENCVFGFEHSSSLSTSSASGLGIPWRRDTVRRAWSNVLQACVYCIAGGHSGCINRFMYICHIRGIYKAC